MDGAVRIVLADDHAVFLDGLTAVLTQAEYDVLATSVTISALLANVQALRPDLCIIESHFADGDGVGAIAQITMVSPHTLVVMLTDDDEPETAHRALRAGAAGYLHKARGVPALVEALRRICAGEVVVEGTFASPRVAGPQASQRLRLLATYLTPRELECLALLASGAGTATIARRLGVSTTTIRSHVQAVLTKLGVHSRLEAASVAIRYGLVGAAIEVEKPAADS
jgi:two-component system nitrate/nitrite response regulator NarL